jgi:short-subunit dehydrogenase
VVTDRARAILITGASSGIGRALALNYAAPGTHLALVGRDATRLERVAADCRAKGATVETSRIDVRARKALADWIRSVDDAHPLDLAIASAGINTGLGIGRLCEDPDAVRAMFEVHVIGALNTIDPAVARMRVRGRGQIALLGSIAGVRGFPHSPSYSAVKAAIHTYAEALRGNLEPQGVTVSLVIPGFVATSLNEKVIAPKPFEMSDTRAAEIIRRGLDRHAAIVAFPRILYVGAFLLRWLPARWVDYALNLVHVDIPETRERALER